MNPETDLVLIKGKEGFWDKTSDIRECQLIDDKCIIIYNNYDKEYPYKKDNVIWRKNPVIGDANGLRFEYDGTPLFHVEKFFDFGGYVRICFYKNRPPVIREKAKLKIHESALVDKRAGNVFQYLRQLSQITGPSLPGETETLLKKQYDALSFVDSKSVLAAFLNPGKFKISDESQSWPIFPFGFNLSQKKATVNALNSQISVIEGPPGTGKTQTILNIIANAVMQNKTVAVVSNNNSATSNVFEKLEKYGTNFIVASLGNRANKDLFFDNQNRRYPDNLESWAVPPEKLSEMTEATIDSGTKLEDLLAVKNEIAILHHELDTLNTEKKYFREYQSGKHVIQPYKAFRKHNSAIISELWTQFKVVLENGGRPTLKYKLTNLFKHGIYSFAFYKNKPDDIIAKFQELFYTRKESELKTQVKSLEAKIANYKFDRALKTYTNDSQVLFKAYLSQQFKGGQRMVFSGETALWKEFKNFIQEYPVILSTTHSLRSCTDKSTLFDYVIMDEASQIDIVAGALALSCAKRAVIVGDLKQLPNVVTDEVKEKTDTIFDTVDLKSSYNYAVNSMLSAITGLFAKAPRTLLREHYRCHPKIIEFCNQKFYQGQLITLTQDNTSQNPLTIYKTVKGNHARGTVNQRQIDVIKEEVLPKLNGNDDAIGIVSPYRSQVDQIDQQVESDEIMVDTVHKYQGREKDMIVLSTVVNEINPFVDNPNLLNVAVSRAVNKLVVVISDKEKNKNTNTNIDDLIRYVEYNNFEIVKSRLYSIFDLLYRHNAEKLAAFKKTRQKISEHESENLMYALITKVLSLQAFQFLGVAVHVPLKMLIRDQSLLTADELKFAVNSWTHLDFVVFNRMDKSAVLAVEVDGHAFHAGNEKQKQRDKLKDSILQRYKFPLIRFATTGSQEEKRLIGKLEAVLLS
jgi:very-short-patch-repair endonuclease/RecA/RadA recombinase